MARGTGSGRSATSIEALHEQQSGASDDAEALVLGEPGRLGGLESGISDEVDAPELVSPLLHDRRDRPSGQALAILRTLPVPAVWVDGDNAVAWVHPALSSMRVVSRGRVVVPAVVSMVEEVRASDQTQAKEVAIRRPGRRRGRLQALVTAHPMPGGAVLAVIEDIAEAQRLDHARRDFVVNVSHELKTPVGALSLLAEAVLQARDDPGAVLHFAGLMVAESARLTSLVNDLLDLSRIEGIDPIHPPEPVSLDEVVLRACEDAAVAASIKGITFRRGGVPDQWVLGVESQLVTAVRNLLVNAVSYSPEGTRVAVSTGNSEGSVTVAVTDQGIGIPTQELDRIFERFYRVDPARSRSTGGTGLGLAIVKHVAANHGGSCEVWSRVGAGSTFTLRLPELTEAQHQRYLKRTPRARAMEGS